MVPCVSAAIGAMAALVLGYFAWLSEEKSRDIQYLEYANKLLTLPVKDGGNIRLFAVNIIQEKTPVEFTLKMRQDFLDFQMPLSTISGPPISGDGVSRLYSRPDSESASMSSRGVVVSKKTERLPARAQFGIVTMPNDIEAMWVFYQRRDVQSPDGCERPPNADPLDPSTFPSRLSEFIAEARRRENTDLIITALSPSKIWGAVNDIRVDGISSQRTVAYYCNGSKNFGQKLDI